jgi:hypothetical protein
MRWGEVGWFEMKKSEVAGGEFAIFDVDQG